MIAYEDFVVDFPEFGDVDKFPENRVQRFIDKAAVQVDSELLLAEDLVGYLAAHLLSISTMGQQLNTSTSTDSLPGTNGRQISSLNVAGEYSVSYSDVTSTQFKSLKNTGDKDTFSLTPYGLEYQRLIRVSVYGPIVV